MALTSSKALTLRWKLRKNLNLEKVDAVGSYTECGGKLTWCFVSSFRKNSKRSLSNLSEV